MIDAHTGWAVGAGNAVLRTADRGGHWTDVTPPHISGQVFAVLQADAADTASVAMTRDGADSVGVFVTHDAGKNWRSVDVRPAQPARVYGLSLNFADAQHGWLLVTPEHGMSSRPGELYATADGGRTWRPEPIPHGPMPGTLSFQSPPRFFPPDHQAGILPADFWPEDHRAVGYALAPFATADGARTWQELKPDATLTALMQSGATMVELDFVDAQTGRAIMTDRSGGIWLLATTDGGATWTALLDGPGDTLVRFRVRRAKGEWRSV